MTYDLVMPFYIATYASILVLHVIVFTIMSFITFPPMVPDHPEADGAAVSRQARDFLAQRWSGRTLMAVGAQDPVLGVPVMQALRAQIRGCPEPIVLPQAGHFVQEHGEEIAREAVGYFRA